MELTADEILRIVLAVVAGGIIGAEREYREKTAGFRTIILITLGAALFTIYSIRIGGPNNPDRIATNIITGVGFLGAGAILRNEFSVTGVTTAATIWLAAAVGMGLGGGYYAITAWLMVVIVAVLWGFPYVEAIIDRRRSVRTYEVVIGLDIVKLGQIEATFKTCGLHLSNHRHLKSEKTYTCVYSVHGNPKLHNALVEKFLEDPEVMELKY
jgi:putative Mg2+ transporter-C (MgtC) family protein